MPKKSILAVNEKISFLESELTRAKKVSSSKRDRIKMLLLIKKSNGFYKSDLAKEIKTKNGNRNRETVTLWIKKYKKSGFNELMSTRYNKRTKIFTNKNKEEIYRLIFKSGNYYESIIEFINSFNNDSIAEIKENTFRKYIKILISAKEFNTLMAKRKKKIERVDLNDLVNRSAGDLLLKLRRE